MFRLPKIKQKDKNIISLPVIKQIVKICYSFGKFRKVNFIDILYISAKIGVTSGVLELGTLSTLFRIMKRPQYIGIQYFFLAKI
jgi:hypothetical protein